MTERPPSDRDLPKSTRKYAPSAKRAARTSEARERIRRAAWDAFSTQGLDAASIAGIVRESGVSTGSFYNHFGSKEALFETFLEELAEEVRALTARARAKADDLETMLRISFEALLEHIVSIEGAHGFIERNQHHLRASLHRFDAMERMLEDLRLDVARGAGRALSAQELDLVARMIFAMGLETILQLDERPGPSSSDAAALMTEMIVRGVGGLGLEKS
ncbi:TetR/AcrR family transcriptional regulator [Sulfitobacter faviae]|uniref:TetR/AcrR family transcriptional regulator n=1 Tax=Sulfitobacter faviae TaxID=1775881 RepID=UPI00398CF826